MIYCSGHFHSENDFRYEVKILNNSEFISLSLSAINVGEINIFFNKNQFQEIAQQIDIFNTSLNIENDLKDK